MVEEKRGLVIVIDVGATRGWAGTCSGGGYMEYKLSRIPGFPVALRSTLRWLWQYLNVDA